MRRNYLAGNWKMHMLSDSALDLVKNLQENIKDIDDVDVAVFPPAPYLLLMKEAIKGSKIKYGAQNMYFEEKGPFTGELSPGMLKDCGCELVLIGHSERRHIFNEKNDMLNKKLKAALDFNLTPFYCIGETLEERESGNQFKVVEKQLVEGLKNISKEEIMSVVIAYEPVWAIGTGKTATPEIAQEIHAYIRDWFRKNYSTEIAEEIRILYGGSIKPHNIKGLIQQPDIDGGLVGGASLKYQDFSQIIRYSR